MPVDTIRRNSTSSLPEEQEGLQPSRGSDSRSASIDSLSYPSESGSSQTESVHGHGSIADIVSGFEGLKYEIDHTRINRALTGTSIENPDRIAVGHHMLHSNLADLEVEEDAGPSAKGKEAQKSANRLSGLLRRAGNHLSHTVGPSSSAGRPSDPVRDDTYRRQTEINNREREHERIQSDPEERAKLRALRGINRKDESGKID